MNRLVKVSSVPELERNKAMAWAIIRTARKTIERHVSTYFFTMSFLSYDIEFVAGNLPEIDDLTSKEEKNEVHCENPN